MHPQPWSNDANNRRPFDGFVALIAAKEDDLPFDDAWAELTSLGLVDELANWRDLARGSVTPSGAVH